MKPEKIILNGLKSLTNLNFYSRIRSNAKARGEITHIGEKKLEKVESQLFSYHEDSYEEKEGIEDFKFLNQPSDMVRWLNFHGLHEIKLFEKLAAEINIDRFTLRQIVDTTLRPKVEEQESYLFFTIHSILPNTSSQLKIEHLAFILGTSCVISFQEEKGDHFDHLRTRLRNNLGIIRKRKSDFLLAQLLDAILDNHLETIDTINQEISFIEQEAWKNPTKETLIKIENAKRSMEIIKKSLKPFKEAIINILNGRTAFIEKGNKKYFRDLKNNCANGIEEADSSLKTLDGLTNIYFASLSHKMNEIMKVLTLVATIFIPLTFIAGIYGMNFENMPELRWPYGYFYALGIMSIVLIGMIFYFRIRKWL